MAEPAQKILVKKYLDWDKVKACLSQYEHIGRHYNFEVPQDCSERGPYYCHYLAWRLGTWKNENWFIFFNELMQHGSSLPNWNNKIKSEDPSKRYEYDIFFHFLWELQVAKFFSEIKGVSVEWTTLGPDIKINSNGKTFYIECYTYTKSFAIESFIEELLNNIHSSIKILHTPCIVFSLPKNANTENFLNDIFTPYLDPHFIESKVKEAEKEYPVLLPIPKGIDNFYIYVDGNNPDKYIPGRLPNASGLPENYLTVCLKEVMNAKKDSNKLSDTNGPILLAVNFLLSQDFQMAANRQEQLNELGLSEQIPFCDFDGPITGIFFSVAAIDDIPSVKNSWLKIKDDINNQILSLDDKFNLLRVKGDKFLCNSC